MTAIYAPHFVAQEKGYYTEEGIDMEIVRAGGGVATPALIVTAGEKRMVFVVDELLDEQEIVVKSLGARIRNVRHVSGATILPSGQIALVRKFDAHIVVVDCKMELPVGVGRVLLG